MSHSFVNGTFPTYLTKLYLELGGLETANSVFIRRQQSTRYH